MKRLLGLTLLLTCLWAHAETTIPDMKFKRLDTRDGLSNSTINCIYQDSKGYVWIGTSYGLNRYDGYRFRTYYSDPNDTTTLRNNYVDQIFEDAMGRLWLRQGMNYSLFDPATERTERNPSRQLKAYGVIGNIDRFYIDSQRNIWVKTYDEGLYCNVPGRRKHTLTKYGYEEGMLPKEFYFSSMADYNGMLLVTSSNGELIGVDPATGKVKWKDRYMAEHGGKNDDAYNLIVDHDGNYWVLTNMRTFVYDQAAKQWYPSVNTFFEAHGLPTLPEPIQIWDVMADKRGWIWIATDHEGLFVVNPKSKEVKQFKNNKFDQTSLSDNTVRHLMADRSGSVWISGYRNGLNQYIETLSGFRTLELGDINTTTEDTQGNYWFGTDNRGIIKYMPKTGETEVYDKARNGFASDIMVACHGASDGSVWFGTYNGGLIQIGSNGHINNYLASNTEGRLLNNNVWSVTEDKWGDIWIGTLGSGVQKLQMKTGKFLTWNSYNKKLSENFITSAGWIKKGWLIVGHSNFYSLINPVSGKVMNFTIPTPSGQAAPMATTVCVVEDSRELIWQGSTAGCCIYDRKTGRQTLLDMNSGLFGSSVVGIAEDKLHTMWVVTEHGISNVIPKQEENGEWTFLVRSFSSKDGLQQGPYNQRSITCTHDGLILVGGLGGVDVIDPKQVTNVGNKERPMFSGLKLFGQQISVGKEYDGHVILDEALDISRELTLRHDENQFTIQLATNKGEMRNPSRFIYQLEGFSDKWMKTEENDPNITYMSLHHGDYVLHVRMLNDDGTMGEEEATLQITITPPLLRNRWLMLLFLACVAGGIWYWRKRFMKKQEERAELERLRRETEKKHWMSEMLKKMREESQRAGGLTEGDVEAPSQHAADAKERIDLVSLFRQECEQFVAPKGKTIRLSFFPIADTLPIYGSRLQMREMLEILLSNSANFSPKGSKVKVFAEQQGDKAVIRVADNGVGIPTEVMPHLFEQIIGDEDSPNLHAVFDIVLSHHGTIRADENKGGGTVFIIEIPLAKSDEQVEEAVIMDE
jgi:ligand-binding sensor domain-containing protein/signal transduction histidine kinase